MPETKVDIKDVFEVIDFTCAQAHIKRDEHTNSIKAINSLKTHFQEQYKKVTDLTSENDALKAKVSELETLVKAHNEKKE